MGAAFNLGTNFEDNYNILLHLEVPSGELSNGNGINFCKLLPPLITRGSVWLNLPEHYFQLFAIILLTKKVHCQQYIYFKTLKMSIMTIASI